MTCAIASGSSSSSSLAGQALRSTTSQLAFVEVSDSGEQCFTVGFMQDIKDAAFETYHAVRDQNKEYLAHSCVQFFEFRAKQTRLRSLISAVFCNQHIRTVVLSLLGPETHIFSASEVDLGTTSGQMNLTHE